MQALEIRYFCPKEENYHELHQLTNEFKEHAFLHRKLMKLVPHTS